MRGRPARVAVFALGGHRLGVADHDDRPGIVHAAVVGFGLDRWLANELRWPRFPVRCSGFVLFMLHTVRLARELTRGSSRKAAGLDDERGPSRSRRAQRIWLITRGREVRLSASAVGPESESLNRTFTSFDSSNTMAGHSENPLDHVIDHPTIELPWWNPPSFELDDSICRKIAGLPDHALHGDGADRGGADGRRPGSGGSPHRPDAVQPRLVHEHVRGDAALHSRRRGPAGDRRPRRRSLLAVSLDGFLLRPVQQLLGMIPGGASATATST